MFKLMNIRGYWNNSYNHEFNVTNMWEGKILVNEDGWFEGIVKTPNGNYKGDRLVFGVYHHNKLFNLYQLTAPKISEPLLFHAVQIDDGYYGNFACSFKNKKFSFGSCKIIAEDAIGENLEQEISELYDEIEDYKDNLDEQSEEFYEDWASLRKSMCIISLFNYEKRDNFTDEEASIIAKEIQTVVNRAVAEPKKYLKKILPSIDIDE